MLPQKKRLLDQVRDRMWLKNYAYRTEKAKHLNLEFKTLRYPVERGGTALRVTDCKAIYLNVIN